MRKDRSSRARRLAAVGALCALAWLAACGAEGPSVDELMARAEAHRATGDLKAAVIELKNVVQKDPRHGVARLRLGEIFVEVGDGIAAEVELRRAEGDAETLALLMARALLMQGKYGEVLAALSVDAVAAEKAKAVALALRGHALIGMGRIEEAEATYASALAHDANCVEAIVGLGRMALGLRDMEKAKRWSARASEAGPSDPKSFLLRGEVAFYAREYDDSQRAFETILKTHRVDALAYAASIGLTRTLIAAGKLKEATAALAPILREAPRDPTANHLRALVAYQSQDLATAQYHSEIAVSIQPDHWQGLFLAAAANYSLGQNERAAKYLGHFVSQFPESVGARSLLAEVQIKMGQPGNALKTLKAGVPEAGEADPQLLGLIGAMIAQAGDLSDARTYFEKVASARPRDAVARARLGVARIALGDAAAGMQDLDEAETLGGDLWQVDFARAVAYLRLRDFAKARGAAQRLLAQLPDHPSALVLAGVAHSATGATAEAKRAFERAHALRPGDAIALRNLAALAVREGQFGDARRHYDELLRIAPGDVSLLIAYGQLELRAGRTQAAMARFEQATVASPEATAPRVELARGHLAAGEPQKALAAAQQILKRNPDERGALEIVGRAYLALGQIPEALTALRALVAAAPDEAAGHLHLSAAYGRAGDAANALAALETAMTLLPGDVDIRVGKVRLLAMAGRVEEGRAVLESVRATAPDSPAVAMAEGALELAAQRPAEAAAAYQRAFAARPNSAALVNLTRARIVAGQLAEAEQDLLDWLRQHPDDILARKTLADFYLSVRSFARAAAEYSEIDRRSPDNVVILNNLAWSLVEQGRGRDAMPYARRAVALAPADPQVLDTLGTALLQTKSFAEAVLVLRRAREKAPDDAGIQVRLALALSRDGNSAEAKALLQKVLKEANAGADRAAAEALLSELGG